MAYRNGLGDYDRVNDWSWLFFPPPYDSVDPKQITPPAEFYAPSRSMGLGCGGSCGCGGRCSQGMSAADTAIPMQVWLGAGALLVGLVAAANYLGKGRR